MRRYYDRRVCILVSASLALAVMACGILSSLRPADVDRVLRSDNPPPSFQDTALVGMWNTHYSGGAEHQSDTLILRADGTFKQQYSSSATSRGQYSFETTWNEWWTERLPDGRLWLYLDGARYYAEGISLAEQDGMLKAPASSLPRSTPAEQPPEPFIAPFGSTTSSASTSPDMRNRLILSVRITESEEIILVHMLNGQDGSSYWHFTRTSQSDMQ